MTVVFSTYRSIDVVSAAQSVAGTSFDIIICDEAHRTTGVTLAGTQDSAFVKVHDNHFLPANKRLYMTATPRIYGDDSKQKAQDASAILCSMDDESLYGPVLYSLGFSSAVAEGLLSDYKVLVLAVDENYVSRSFQHMMTDDSGNELRLEDKVKIIGCWNGLSKRLANGELLESSGFAIDPEPMRRAVAFSSRIADSKQVKTLFTDITKEYLTRHPDDDTLVRVEIDHVDGTYNALDREKRIHWLKEATEENTCRILTNARCLSEGIDVPALDAVMFLSPRNSIIDIVQSVGRVMRKTEGKKYGYVILPIGIPAGQKPEEALKDNVKYKVVWDVLQALRAHDDRFNNTINKIDLNVSKPPQIQVIGITGDPSDGEKTSLATDSSSSSTQIAMSEFELEEWKNGIYAKIVEKCGEKTYWENWAKDVAGIAKRHIEQITALIDAPDSDHKEDFDLFLKGLRANLNASISEADAIEMLAQHMITKPVFDALFEGYSFVKSNPVSASMQRMLESLEEGFVTEESLKLAKFYASVQDRAKGIDNASGKQRIIIELYDKFFSTAFKKTAERLGIVYTPVECVDFILHSVEHVLQKEFGVSMSDRDVHILDPFTGTGTFIVRLLQSGIIRKEDLLYKYMNEIHANEIVLLAYYIAAINIEETFHHLTGKKDYVPFEGIVLTDTFQLTETNTITADKSFPENSDRVRSQRDAEIRVIISNPPYNVGQGNANDDNKSLHYQRLDEAINNTYVFKSTATNKSSLYDSYIRAFRWASDRIKKDGIVCYISNGAYIDNVSMNGFRQCLLEEYTSVYCFNLRGNARTSGELRKREAGNVFDSGSRTPIAITLLVKNSQRQPAKSVLYFDIGDYLSQKEKLDTLIHFHDVSTMSWKTLTPDLQNDWINLRNDEFERYIPIGSKEKENVKTIFNNNYSMGVKTNRDAWVYNSSHSKLRIQMSETINFYNAQMKAYRDLSAESKVGPERIISYNSNKIKWAVNLIGELKKKIQLSFHPEYVRVATYRPFQKQWHYCDPSWNERLSLQPSIMPNNHENFQIVISGTAASKNFSSLIVDTIPNLHLLDTCQAFPLYYYEETKPKTKYDAQQTMFHDSEKKYNQKDAITDFYWKRCRDLYGSTVTKKDIFYFVYGLLHSKDYREKYAADLKKTLPRIPFVRDFWRFSKAGRALAELHLDYETVTPYLLTETRSGDDLKVFKMRYPKKDQKDTIIYNSSITLSGIPAEAYEYQINGKSAIEWIMDRYQVTVDKDSGIKNDPNDWSEDPRYIIDLLKRIVMVSLETMKIVKGLPELDIIE